MQTYSETKNEKPINWYAELTATEINWEKLKALSHSWVTCACGNQCDVIPRREDGAPDDSTLRHLGYRFYWTITEKNKEDALKILKQIEERSSQLINLIRNSKKC